MLTSPSTRPSSTDLSFFSKSKSSNPVASTSSVVVTTRLTRVRTLPVSRTQSPASSSDLSSSLESNTSKKRKRSTGSPDFYHEKKPRASPSVGSAGLKPPTQHVRRRATSSTSSLRHSSRPLTAASSPEPIYRGSRSRSTSTFPSVEAPVVREYWIEEDGSPGPGFLSSEIVVRNLMRTYKGYFKNLDDPEDKSYEPHPTNYPVSELEYPNSGGCERFMLLAPKDKDHYNPIMCLEKSLYTIIEHYLTPSQQSLFGTPPTDLLSDVVTPPPSPSPSPPSSQSSNASSTLSSLTSLSSTSSPPPKVNYLRAVQRAIHRQDGPLFHRTMRTINALLRSLKYPRFPTDDLFGPSPTNTLKETVKSWSTSGIPKKVLLRIIEESYQRSVGPHVQSLHRYEAFSSEVYGELMPAFTSDIITATGLGPGSLLLDLGSGVGNVVIQASLQTGCTSYGIEVMPAPAKVAREQLEQFKTRCRMWCVAMGEVELEEGDMLQSKRVSELISKADVVLVNNKVFLESLNEALRPKFLDLKEGAVVVSLKPFVSSLNARVTERNVDDISAIFDVTERPYHSGSVSWGSGGGSYYLHRVDREGYASIRERFENSRAGSGRSSRSSRRW